MNHLDKAHLLAIVEQALADDEELKKIKVNLKETEALFNLSGGDARKLLNILELVVKSDEDPKKVVITNEKVITIVQRKNGNSMIKVVKCTTTLSLRL